MERSSTEVGGARHFFSEDSPTWGLENSPKNKKKKILQKMKKKTVTITSIHTG